VAWLGAILTATSLPDSLFPKVGIRNADKGVHFTMYAILGLLIARAMHNPPRTTRLRVVLAAFFLVVAFGAVDEWHQQYMKGRSTDVRDWVADATGGLIGALVWVAVSRANDIRNT
jgi:VanZ family protein